MQALVRELPDRISSLTGTARDLTATTVDRTRREFDRAKDLSSGLRRRLEGMVDRDTKKSLERLGRREADRARELGGALQRRLTPLLHRDKRSYRLPLAVSALVVGAAIGGALLANPRLRAKLRDGWKLLRYRPSQPLRVGDGSAGAAMQPPSERQEDQLDDALAGSFPASDPVSAKQIT